MVFFREMRVQKITKIGLQGFEIALEEFVEWSVGHGRNIIYDSDFGISKLGLGRGLTESTST